MLGAGNSFKIKCALYIKEYFRIAVADQLSYKPTTTAAIIFIFIFLSSCVLTSRYWGRGHKKEITLILISIKSILWYNQFHIFNTTTCFYHLDSR
jgi:hypothetical protein